MPSSSRTPWYLPDTPLGRGAAAGAAIGLAIGLALLLHAAPPGQAARWMGDPVARAVVRRAAVLVLALTALGAAVTAALFLLVEQVRDRLAPHRPSAASKASPKVSPRRPQGVGPTALRHAPSPSPPPSSLPPSPPPPSAQPPTAPPPPAPLEPAAQPAPPAAHPPVQRSGQRSLRSLIRTTEDVLAEVDQQAGPPTSRPDRAQAEGTGPPGGGGSPARFLRLAAASADLERLADTIAAEQAEGGMQSDSTG